MNNIVIGDEEKQRGTISMSEVLDRLSKHTTEQHYKKRLVTAENEEWQKLNHQMRKDADKSYMQNEAHLRWIARVPMVLFRQAQRLYGQDFWKDDKLFRKVFVEDEVGRMCLVVPPNTL